MITWFWERECVYLAKLLGGWTGSIRGVRLLLTFVCHLESLKWTRCSFAKLQKNKWDWQAHSVHQLVWLPSDFCWLNSYNKCQFFWVGTAKKPSWIICFTGTEQVTDLIECHEYIKKGQLPQPEDLLSIYCWCSWHLLSDVLPELSLCFYVVGTICQQASLADKKVCLNVHSIIYIFCEDTWMCPLYKDQFCVAPG